ncbi:nitrilase-related carbon-nitrogen hydrolase, partial [Candidatus Margulisiibacteriota bacterium]
MPIKTALIQLKLSTESNHNFAQAVAAVHTAASKGAQIICLPELYKNHYFCQEEDDKNFNL